MSVADLAIVAALVFGWGALSARLERFDVTAPITFVVAGLLLTHGPLAFLGVAPSKELIKELAEFTLALVLFSDASRVGLHELRVDAGLYLRLLGVALPLTIGLGTLLALALDRSAGIWLALLVGAALAPTDAALGAGMMANPVVPARIRRLINVESGLNDGIATPFVSVALAGAATAGAGRRPRSGRSGRRAGSGHSHRRGRRRCGWPAGERGTQAGLGRRGLCRPGGAGPGGVRLRILGGAARQRVHRRVRRRARVRHHGWPARRAPDSVRRGNRRAGVPAGLAGVRRCRSRTRGGGPELADRPVRGPQPHGDPDGAGGGSPGRRTAWTGQRSPWWPGSVPAAWRR